MIRPTVKPLLTTSYTEVAGRLILDLPEELVAELYVCFLVRKFQGRLKKVRAAEEWTRKHFARATAGNALHDDSVMRRNNMQSQVIPIHIWS
jgi:hypothetical protein